MSSTLEQICAFAAIIIYSIRKQTGSYTFLVKTVKVLSNWPKKMIHTWQPSVNSGGPFSKFVQEKAIQSNMYLCL